MENAVSKTDDFRDQLYDDSYLLNLSVKYIGPLIKDYLKRYTQHQGRLLDVGCGNGSVPKFLRDEFKDRFSYHGLDFLENKDTHPENPIQFWQGDLNKNFSQDLDPYDVVVSCEVIEHVIDTDHYIEHIKKLMKPDGIFIVTTPNLASFFNRILLAMGYQPLHTEVSWKNPYIGRESLYKIVGQDKAPAAGHLRLFTQYALKKFLEYHGFEVIVQKGFTPYEGLMGTLSQCFSWAPSLMPGLFFVCKKRP